jgi:galactoside O-acetyltransferase
MPVYRDSIIKIGDNVTFSGTSIQCYDRVTIKDKCAIANAYIVDSPAHHLSVDRKDRDDRELPHAPVTVEQGAWISVNTVVTHGVTIGEFSVIGACALVRKDVKPRSLYAGVPAEFIRELSTTEDSNKSEDLHGVSCSNVPTVS